MKDKKYLMTFEELVKFNKDMCHASTMSFEQVTENWLKYRGKKPVEYKPKETVIARGKVDYQEDLSYGDNVLIGDVDILSELFDYDGKTIEIILREVTDTDSLGNNAEPVKQYPEDDPGKDR